jgi:hypothetical protein
MTLSILPQPLPVDASPDNALAAVPEVVPASALQKAIDHIGIAALMGAS